MARARKTWTTMLGEIRSILGEETAAASQWSDSLLLTCFNSCLDYRLSQMAEVDEDWLTETRSVNVVSGTNSYALTTGDATIKRVLRVFTSGGITIESPIERLDHWRENQTTAGASNTLETWNPTYRLSGGYILFDPVPGFSATGGIKVELEPFPSQFTTGNDKLPAYFPDILETLLVWDSADTAMAIEGTMGQAPEGFANHIKMKVAQLENVFLRTIERRQKTPTSSRPFRLGA